MATNQNAMWQEFARRQNARQQTEANRGTQAEAANPATFGEQYRQGDARSFSSSSYNPAIPGSLSEAGEGTQDTVFRLIRDRIAASRARYNSLGATAGATEAMLAGAADPLRDQLDRVDSSGNLLAGLTGRLTSSALGSTAGASMAAVNAARMSGDGRFGGGGNAAAVAVRGATQAAVGQSAALSQAIVQGQLGEANYQQQVLQQRGGVAAALSQLLQSQAGLREQRGQLGVAMESEHANILGSAMQVYGNLTGIRNQKSKKDDLPSLFGLI